MGIVDQGLIVFDHQPAGFKQFGQQPGGFFSFGAKLFGRGGMNGPDSNDECQGDEWKPRSVDHMLSF